ncbi:acyl-CoA thioesterase [Planctomicrobium sp. SH661]|uniref:acyl-CoA thioesterase n=1 Tax=Planctomicrobium sp. SH661 TaxID=3448124 RepID=UPI003F5C091E
MALFFEYEHQVRSEEIDGLGHANNVSYFSWMQEAAIAHSTLQGWSTQAYEDRGWAWLVRTHHIEYRRPALVGELIRIKTWVADMTRFTSLRKFEMYRDQALIARAETNWAFVDIRQGKLMAIPQEVSAAFEIPAE